MSITEEAPTDNISSEASVVPKKSHRQPTCSKAHYLWSRVPVLHMDSESEQQPSSPSVSTLSSHSGPDMTAFMHFFAEQSAKQEEARRQHELAMLKLQSDLFKLQEDNARARSEEDERARRRDDEAQLTQAKECEARQAALQQTKEEADKKQRLESSKRQLKRDMPKLSDKDFPPTFMAMFECLAVEQDVPKSQWTSCFVYCLSGQELTIWSTLLDTSVDGDYDMLKHEFFNRVGHDWSSNARFFSCAKKPMHVSYDQYLHECYLRLLQLIEGLEDKKAIAGMMVKACASNFLTGMRRTELCLKKDLPLHEYGKFLGDHDFSSYYSSGRREGSSYHRRSYSGSKSDNSERQVEVAHISAPSPSPKPVVGGNLYPQDRRPHTMVTMVPFVIIVENQATFDLTALSSQNLRPWLEYVLTPSQNSRTIWQKAKSMECLGIFI